MQQQFARRNAWHCSRNCWRAASTCRQCWCWNQCKRCRQHISRHNDYVRHCRNKRGNKCWNHYVLPHGNAYRKTLLVAGVCSAIGYGAWKYTPTTAIAPAPTTDRLSAPLAQMQRETAQNKPTASTVAAKAPNTAAPTSASAADARKRAGREFATAVHSVRRRTASSLSKRARHQSKSQCEYCPSAAQELRSKIEQLAVQLRLERTKWR